MPHRNKIKDLDAVFEINPITRDIKNVSTSKRVLVQYDHNSEKFTFSLPRHIEGHDMTECNRVQVHYETNGGYTDCVELSGLKESASDPEKVVCTWLVSQNATRDIGALKFLLKFACVNNDTGEYEYIWSTGLFNGISVSEGMNNVAGADDIPPDFLYSITQQLENKVDKDEHFKLAMLGDAGTNKVLFIGDSDNSDGVNFYSKEQVDALMANAGEEKKRYVFENCNIPFGETGEFELDSSGMSSDELCNAADEILLRYTTDDVLREYLLPHVSSNLPYNGAYYSAFVNDTTFIWVKQDIVSAGGFTGGVVALSEGTKCTESESPFYDITGVMNGNTSGNKSFITVDNDTEEMFTALRDDTLIPRAIIRDIPIMEGIVGTAVFTYGGKMTTDGNTPGITDGWIFSASNIKIDGEIRPYTIDLMISADGMVWTTERAVSGSSSGDGISSAYCDISASLTGFGDGGVGKEVVINNETNLTLAQKLLSETQIPRIKITDYKNMELGMIDLYLNLSSHVKDENGSLLYWEFTGTYVDLTVPGDENPRKHVLLYIAPDNTGVLMEV